MFGDSTGLVWFYDVKSRANMHDMSTKNAIFVGELNLTTKQITSYI